MHLANVIFLNSLLRMVAMPILGMAFPGRNNSIRLRARDSGVHRRADRHLERAGQE